MPPTPSQLQELPRPPLVSTILPAGASDGTAPPNIALTGNTTLIESSNTTVGSISLQGNSTLYVHSPSGRTTFTILGNVYVNNSATFFVNGSNLLIGESYDVEWGIYLTGTPKFGLESANVTMNGYQWGAEYANGANVTIVDSYVGYPSGWVDTDLVGAPRLTLLSSWYSSDVILFDSSVAPSTANFSAAFSVGFNVWLNFKSGTTANLSLPGLDTAGNWTFPGADHVSGVNYTVNLYFCIVSIFAVMLWQGANLTLANSPDLAISLNVVAGNVALAGLSQSPYANYSLRSGGFTLQLWNTTVFTWNLYPFGGAVTVASSQIGEIQVFNAATTRVDGSTLTADGGYYGEQGTGSLFIVNSTIEGQIVGYSSVATVENCSVNSPGTSQVLATGTGRVDATNTTLASQDTYRALGQGVIQIAWPVTTTFTLAGAPAASAAVALRDLPSLAPVDAGTASSVGIWAIEVTSVILNASSSSSPSYVETAASPGYGATLAIGGLVGPVSYRVGLSPLVDQTTPANGSVNVSTNLAAVVVRFHFPMNESQTMGAVTIVPTQTGVQPGWDAAGQTLTLSLSGALLANTTYHVQVSANALTADDIPFGGSYASSFQTAPAPLAVPAVTASSPTNGATNVSVNASVTVRFSLPMSVGEIAAAFSISPSSAHGSVASNSTALVWTPSSPMAYATNYTVTVSTAAKSAAGAALAAPYVLSFRTASAPAAPHPNPTATPPTAAPPGPPWMEYAFAGVIVLAVLAGIASLVFWRRGRRPGPTAPAAPTSSVAPPAPWDEDEPASR
ncbi:MAG: Ig-like domain-containing protein [Thermoplasmata archaeon]|nr:Ig-like domain-containing protein [Thermoplasmata archaeon]